MKFWRKLLSFFELAILKNVLQKNIFFSAYSHENQSTLKR